jgi:hypothetical protein
MRSKESGVYVLQLTHTTFIDAADPSSGAARYSNASRSQNVTQKQFHGNNAHFTLNRRDKIAWITATRNVKAGEEVFTAYGGSFLIPVPTPKAKAPLRQRAQKMKRHSI